MLGGAILMRGSDAAAGKPLTNQV
ncbi:hypothetical protein ERY430_40982 [Erythrobacter sp. EC-HK427]|nr:hypothetical protein ERY430_40982 [Erythrobacter sp. EC-HK427]